METKVDKRTNAHKNSVAARGENESLEQPSPLKQVESSTTTGAGVPPKPKPDLLHCPRCGVELLEDERNGKSAAHCRACIWENA